MKLSTSCLVYYCFHYWSNNRLYYLAKDHLKTKIKQQLIKEELDQKGKKSKEQQESQIPNVKLFILYDFIWLIVYTCYIIGFIIIPAYITLSNNLPPASAMTVIMEQVIFIKLFLLLLKILL
jgi:hypothetical protein